jgi:putative aldouronate transport system permease protein
VRQLFSSHRRLGVSALGATAIYAALIVVLMIMVLPLVHELANSFSDPAEVDAGRVILWPRKFTLGNYTYYQKFLWTLLRSLEVTVYITVVGTILSVFMTALTAFPISRPRGEFRLGNLLLLLFVFTIVFQPPIIPYFLTIRAYGLMDTLWSIIVPHLVISFHLVIMVSFFRQLPQELFDSCRIDGAGEFMVFLKIAWPLSKAARATLTIFTAIILWNIFLHPLMFIRDANKYPLQIFLRSFFNLGIDRQSTFAKTDPFAYSWSTKSALVVLTTLPIVLIYPFMQRHFVKGIILGSLKQ